MEGVGNEEERVEAKSLPGRRQQREQLKGFFPCIGE